MNYYSFHIGDYRSATAHLTNEEDLCYRRILDTYYDRNGNLPEIKLLSRKIRCEEGMIEAILGEFFTLSSDGSWVHDRAQREIDLYTSRVEVAHKNGKLGGRRKSGLSVEEPKPNPTLTTSVPFANPTLTKPLANQEPLTNNQEPITTPAPPVQEGGGKRDWLNDFNEFWNLYPEHRKGNRYRAESAWSAVRLLLPDQNALMEALAAFIASSEWKRDNGKYVTSLHQWLSEHRWQDAPAYSAPPQKAKSVTGKPIPSVDESHAREWLAENYVGSDPSMTFAQWPPFAQTDYLSSLKNQNLIQTQSQAA